MAAFRTLPQVAEVLGSRAHEDVGPLAQRTAGRPAGVEPARWGTALQYFTGSQAHNVELRELALSQGWSLNEYALTQ